MATDMIEHEYSGRGSHRLVINGVPGPWAQYSDPAVMGSYMAFTDYFGERVIRYTTVKAVVK